MNSLWDSPDSIHRPGYRPRREPHEREPHEREPYDRDDPFGDENEDMPAPEAASVNGTSMEAVVIRNGRSSVASSGDLIRRGNHRDVGVLEARNRVWEDIANKMLPPEESELMVKFLEKGPDERSRITYIEGVMQPQVDEHAPVPWVGLTFLPGADKPQVTRLEQTNMAGGEPDQKDAMWRAKTAASLLKTHEVTADLSVVQKYNASDVQALVERCKKPPFPAERSDSRSQDPRIRNHRSSNSTAITRKVPGREPITIDSDFVKIVHKLHEHTWDLQSTLIEVDGSSLLNLIVNYKHLISRGGPEMSFDETKTLLDMMIEDARRLCVRSPVLFRMSTRSHIIHSKNTRYGISHREMFRTLTTSQGIKEIISLSAAYFNSLDPAGSSDKTQELIRPRFLQMIVMLLSLLNDDDLTEIADFLEATYRIKADRKHLEMLFLKVIPLMSINSKVFLKSLVPAYEGYPLPPQYSDTKCWDTFVQRILKDGYLLPGAADYLGRETKSWIVKWPEDGFRNTLVFNNLQYASKEATSWTINDIPAIEIHPEASLKEVPVMFTDGELYTIGKDDLERITCLTPGAYNVQEAQTGGRNYDLMIYEYHINGDLNEAIRRTNLLVATINGLTGYIKKGFKGIFTSNGGRDIRPLSECRNSGRITKSTAELQEKVLAVAYKIEGRKITTKDAYRTMLGDIREMKGLLQHVERRITEISTPSADKIQLRADMRDISNLINHAERARSELNDSTVLSDEPITKVLTGGTGETGAPVWFDYHAWAISNSSDRNMHFVAKRSHVLDVNWLSDANIEVMLVGHDSKYYVTPLQPVLETQRADEIKRGDIAILAGKYMILADADEGDDREEAPLFMSNYLKITSVEEVSIKRRGRNRAQQSNPNVETLFR
jgi:hypothetical protein